jgi:dTDP-4-amino-4,6-dideoxygalactose transaminase
MDSIVELARERRIKVIEDCAQAHGATYKSKPVGSLADVGCFSFCQDKIMSTAGEGGMLVTHSPEVWQRAWSFKDHGKSVEAMRRGQGLPAFQWLHESFGTNWRLTELQSALGRVLLRDVNRQVAIRRRNAAILSRRFSQIPALRLTVPPPYVGHAYYKYYVFLRTERLRRGWDQQRIVSAIKAEGAPCYTGSCSEIYLEKAFAAAMRPPERLQVARELGETSLMFLVHPTLSVDDMNDVGRAVEKVMDAASF